MKSEERRPLKKRRIIFPRRVPAPALSAVLTLPLSSVRIKQPPAPLKRAAASGTCASIPARCKDTPSTRRGRNATGKRKPGLRRIALLEAPKNLLSGTFRHSAPLNVAARAAFQTGGRGGNHFPPGLQIDFTLTAPPAASTPGFANPRKPVLQANRTAGPYPATFCFPPARPETTQPGENRGDHTGRLWRAARS